ncbi:MAG: MarR family transcriptional regulator [Leptolyngbyaceae cyanobacterium SL_7_1]|nr:MarR family transcriptional regulator [Leptolyngbyaceae cyanobacterium SL_7_1]
MSKPHYRLSCEEWLCVSQSLKLAELRVLYYLRTLYPFGDRQLDLRVVDIAATTGLTKGTVSKALQSLASKEYIDLELISVRVRVNSAKKFPTGNLQVSQETSESCRKLSSDLLLSEPPQDKGSKNGNVPIDQTCLNKPIGTHTNEQRKNLVHPTQIEELTNQIWDAGIRANRTIQKEVATRLRSDPNQTAKAVIDALSSYQEHKETIKNPEGFFLTALRQGYTANEAKRTTRAKGEQHCTGTDPPAALSPVNGWKGCTGSTIALKTALVASSKSI